MNLFVSTNDLRLFWEGKGILAVYATAGPNWRKECEEAAFYYCPDKALRKRLRERLRSRQRRACARGEHQRGYGAEECIYCKAPMPYTEAGKAQFALWTAPPPSPSTPPSSEPR